MSPHKKPISKKSAFNRKRKLTRDNNRSRIAKLRKLGFQEYDVSPSFTAVRSRKEDVIQEQNEEDNQVIIDLSSSEEETEGSLEDNSNP